MNNTTISDGASQASDVVDFVAAVKARDPRLHEAMVLRQIVATLDRLEPLGPSAHERTPPATNTRPHSGNVIDLAMKRAQLSALAVAEDAAPRAQSVVVDQDRPRARAE